VYASGKTSTAAGLTASVTKDFDMDKEKVIEPGALMLADNGVCCIDEFELMDAKDQVAIHEAMEQQTITLSKAGIQATLNARTSILAACLPKNTRYQATLPLHKNVDMSPPIMSRFDLIFVMQDIFDPTTDNRVAEHIMSLHRGRGKKREGDDSLTPKELALYIATAKEIEPKISKQAHEHLVHCYKKLRDQSRSSDRGAAGVTVRQLESLIRLSEAVARVHLDPEVKVEYVVEAYRLQTDTMNRAEKETIDLAPEIGEVELDAAAEGDAGAPAQVPAVARKRKITYADYTRMGNMLGKYLQRQEEDGNDRVTEEDLIEWYMNQKEDEFETEAQLLEEQGLLQLVINRMVDKDRVLLVSRPSDDHNHPERRILVKHPNWDTSDMRIRTGSRTS